MHISIVRIVYPSVWLYLICVGLRRAVGLIGGQHSGSPLSTVSISICKMSAAPERWLLFSPIRIKSRLSALRVCNELFFYFGYFFCLLVSCKWYYRDLFFFVCLFVLIGQSVYKINFNFFFIIAMRFNIINKLNTAFILLYFFSYIFNKIA